MLRLAVNLARFTKTRVCLSCFGSTNSGTRLFTKTQICLSCFDSANLGHFAGFQSSDGLFTFGCCLFASPLSSHSMVLVHLDCLHGASCTVLRHDPIHSMHLANEFDLTALASVSSSRLPQLGICCANLFEFVFGCSKAIHQARERNLLYEARYGRRHHHLLIMVGMEPDAFLGRSERNTPILGWRYFLGSWNYVASFGSSTYKGTSDVSLSHLFHRPPLHLPVCCGCVVFVWFCLLLLFPPSFASARDFHQSFLASSR